MRLLFALIILALAKPCFATDYNTLPKLHRALDKAEENARDQRDYTFRLINLQEESRHNLRSERLQQKSNDIQQERNDFFFGSRDGSSNDSSRRRNSRR